MSNSFESDTYVFSYKHEDDDQSDNEEPRHVLQHHYTSSSAEGDAAQRDQSLPVKYYNRTVEYLRTRLKGAGFEKMLRIVLLLIPSLYCSLSSSIAAHLNFSSLIALLYIVFALMGPNYICGISLLSFSFFFGFLVSAAIATICWSVGLAISDTSTQLTQELTMFFIFLAFCVFIVPSLQNGHFSQITKYSAIYIAAFSEMFLLMGMPTVLHGFSFSMDNQTITEAEDYLLNVGISPDDWSIRALQAMSYQISQAVLNNVSKDIVKNVTFPAGTGTNLEALGGVQMSVYYTYENQSIGVYVPPGTWYVTTSWTSSGAVGFFLPMLAVSAISLAFYIVQIICFPQRYATTYMRCNLMFVTKQVAQVVKALSFQAGLSTCLARHDSDDDSISGGLNQSTRVSFKDTDAAIAIRDAMEHAFLAIVPDHLGGEITSSALKAVQRAPTMKAGQQTKLSNRTFTRALARVNGKLEDQVMKLGSGHSNMGGAIRVCNSILSEMERYPALCAMEVSLNNPGPFTSCYSELARITMVLKRASAHALSSWDSTSQAAQLCGTGKSFLSVFFAGMPPVEPSPPPLPPAQSPRESGGPVAFKAKVRFEGSAHVPPEHKPVLPSRRRSSIMVTTLRTISLREPANLLSATDRSPQRGENSKQPPSFSPSIVPILEEEQPDKERALPEKGPEEPPSGTKKTDLSEFLYEETEVVPRPLKGVLKHKVPIKAEVKAEKRQVKLSQRIASDLSDAVDIAIQTYNTCSQIYIFSGARVGTGEYEILRRMRKQLQQYKQHMLRIKSGLHGLFNNTELLLKDSRRRQNFGFSLTAHSAVAEFEAFVVDCTVEVIEATDILIVNSSTARMAGFAKSLLGAFLPLVTPLSSLVSSFTNLIRPWKWTWSGKHMRPWYKRSELWFGIQYVAGFGIIIAISIWCGPYADFQMLNMPEVMLFLRQLTTSTTTNSQVSSFCALGFVTTLALTVEGTVQRAVVRMAGVLFGTLLGWMIAFICGDSLCETIALVCLIVALIVFLFASPSDGKFSAHSGVAGVMSILIIQVIDIVVEAHSTHAPIDEILITKCVSQAIGIGTAVVVSHCLCPSFVSITEPETIAYFLDSIGKAFLCYSQAAVLGSVLSSSERLILLQKGDTCLCQSTELYESIRRYIRDTHLISFIKPWHIDATWINAMENLQTLLLIVNAYRDKIIRLHPYSEEVSVHEFQLWLTSLFRLTEYLGDVFRARTRKARMGWTLRTSKSALLEENEAMGRFSEELEELNYLETRLSEVYEQVLLAVNRNVDNTNSRPKSVTATTSTMIKPMSFSSTSSAEGHVWCWLTTVASVKKIELELVCLMNKCATLIVDKKDNVIRRHHPHRRRKKKANTIDITGSNREVYEEYDSDSEISGDYDDTATSMSDQ